MIWGQGLQASGTDMVQMYFFGGGARTIFLNFENPSTQSKVMEFTTNVLKKMM